MSWARVKGHEPLIRLFERAVGRGRLGHAYLFVGPEGVGKKLFAVELAKALLCEDPPAGRFDACDRCPGCVQVEARTHPDFQLVGLPEESHEFPIQLMQEVIEKLAYKPARQRMRVAIIDDADAFSEEAANCFLKTLEEPPPASLLILIGTRADRQWPTILSRCQVIRFAPLPEAVVAEQLQREGIVEQANDAVRLARLSHGSLGEARALAGPELWSFRRTLLDGLSQPRVDSVGLAQALVKFVEEVAKETAPRRQRAGQVLGFVIELLRAALLLQHGQAAQAAQAAESSDAADALAARRLAERVDSDRLIQVIERFLEADYQVDRRLQLQLVLEAVLDSAGERLQGSGVRNQGSGGSSPLMPDS